jgi:hypothetical protein
MDMTDFQQQLNRTVERFVKEVTEIARRGALETLGSAFGTRAGEPKAVARKPMSPVGRARSRRGQKRTPEDIEAVSQRLVSYVMSNPGLRVEQINKGLGTTTKDLALPIKKLIADRALRSKGQKRSTTYFPGDRARA